MVFNSLAFIAFFAIVLVIHSLPLGWTNKKINLLLASYLFYAAWNPPFILLLWISTIVDWYAAQKLAHARRNASRHAWMLLSVIVNLGMLGYFKYGNFVLENFGMLVASFGIAYRPPHFDIVLPVGISFYTFATMSYTLDIYLRRAAPARNFLDYALFVTFFPHLVAGPIMRPTELVPQFETPRKATPEMLRFGLALMTLGLFQKVVLADTFLAPVVEAVYDRDRIAGALDAWMATLAFSGQIFCDFAGYSTTAIGVAMCLGFAMPDNFRFPYAAIGFIDFWRRWHITLSSWLRDYLYIPLGGNRHGEARTYLALMVTMLLGGLWHGANWTFVAWGGLHGVYLVTERKLRSWARGYRPGPAAMASMGLVTFALINVTWVFFRAKKFAIAWQILSGMFGAHPEAAPILSFMRIASVTLIVGGILCTHWALRNGTLEFAVGRTREILISGLLASMAFAVVAVQGEGNAFIYFQF
ncbi:MAG TPA: MBOAT family protein [Magnetospirillaceae bacterium]|nr:MBOAT family protein [Magnetospirillaceae bacterium]